MIFYLLQNAKTGYSFTIQKHIIYKEHLQLITHIRDKNWFPLNSTGIQPTMGSLETLEQYKKELFRTQIKKWVTLRRVLDEYLRESLP